MNFIRKLVPVKWQCRDVGVVECSKDAVFDSRFGWLCDCERWMLDNDKHHEVFLRAERDVYVHDTQVLVSYGFVNPYRFEHTCDKCHMRISVKKGRWVRNTGFWICYSCYSNREY